MHRTSAGDGVWKGQPGIWKRHQSAVGKRNPTLPTKVSDDDGVLATPARPQIHGTGEDRGSILSHFLLCSLLTHVLHSSQLQSRRLKSSAGVRKATRYPDRRYLTATQGLRIAEDFCCWIASVVPFCRAAVPFRACNFGYGGPFRHAVLGRCASPTAGTGVLEY